MKISELGEFGLVDLLAKMVSDTENKRFAPWQQLILGIGDDAAAWHGDTSIQLATVDALRENIHFTLETTSWKDLGWKALAVNLSDIAAMGGVPKYALVSLALPGHTEVDDAMALYQGIIELAQQFEVAIVGGDTDSAPQVETTITVIGSTENPLLTRSRAETGDKIAVTGYLGAAAAGLEMLTRHLQFDHQTTVALREAFNHPNPRVSEGQILAERGARAAIDISDGLIIDINRICQASKVSARIEVDRVPIHPAVKAGFGDRALELALGGGEDYELLFTASAEVITSIQKATTCPITVIGEIVAGKPGRVTLVDSQGNPVSLIRKGWEHFISQ